MGLLLVVLKRLFGFHTHLGKTLIVNFGFGKKIKRFVAISLLFSKPSVDICCPMVFSLFCYCEEKWKFRRIWYFSSFVGCGWQ